MPEQISPLADDARTTEKATDTSRILAVPAPRRGLFSHPGLSAAVTFFVFVAILLGYAIWLGGRFVTTDPRMLDIHQTVPLLLIAIGLCVVLASGQFDLSVGGIVTLTTYLTVGLVAVQGLPFWLVILIVLAVALLAGVFNAVLVVRLRVNAFIATLGTGGVAGGFAVVYSGGTQLSPGVDGPRLPAWFSGSGSFGSFQQKAPEIVTWLIILWTVVLVVLVIADQLLKRSAAVRYGVSFGAGAVIVVLFATVLGGVVGAMPWPVLFLVAVANVMWIVLRYTVFGRNLYATGGNAAAARLAGVNTGRITTAAFLVSAMISGIAGIVLAGIQGAASPGIGDRFLLPAYAAAFLSTVILSNGRFHVWGTVAGGILLTWVGQGLVVGGVNFAWTGVINGLVLVAAVALSSIMRRGRAAA